MCKARQRNTALRIRNAKQSKEILCKAGQRSTAQRRSANAVEWSGRAGALLHFPLSACPLLTEQKHHLHHEEDYYCDDEVMVMITTIVKKLW